MREAILSDAFRKVRIPASMPHKKRIPGKEAMPGIQPHSTLLGEEAPPIRTG